MIENQGAVTVASRSRTARFVSLGAMISALLALATEVAWSGSSNSTSLSTLQAINAITFFVFTFGVSLSVAAGCFDFMKVPETGKWQRIRAISFAVLSILFLSLSWIFETIASGGLIGQFSDSPNYNDAAFDFTAWSLLAGLLASLVFVVDSSLSKRLRKKALAKSLPQAGSLAERVKQAQESLSRTGAGLRATLDNTTRSLNEALGTTTRIVDALEEELRTRRAALDELTAQAQIAQERADHARELARVEESTAHALDALLDRRLAERLEALESAGHRWDTKITGWSLLASLLMGIAAGYLVAYFPHLPFLAHH